MHIDYDWEIYKNGKLLESGVYPADMDEGSPSHYQILDWYLEDNPSERNYKGLFSVWIGDDEENLYADEIEK